MKYYLDITLLPDAEASLSFLWHKIYQQVHLALVDKKTAENTSNIALSIPKYKIKCTKDEYPLGNTLRLFAPTKDLLNALDIKQWLSRFNDYAHCKPVKEVPSTNSFVVFKRKHFKTYKQFKNKQAYLIEKRLEYTNETLEQARAHVERVGQKYSEWPFIKTKSLSSGSRFPLFIEKQNVETEKIGRFNCYGLSMVGATVPYF